MPILPAEMDPHSYQPRTQEIIKLKTLDLIVTNGIGHDQFLQPMLEAVNFPSDLLINPNQGVTLLSDVNSYSELRQVSLNSNNYNSHTFLSITGAVNQIYNITEKLAEKDPDNAKYYHRNSRTYVRNIRKILAHTLSYLTSYDITKARIAAVHDGYQYIIEELGLTLLTVFQPRHGIQPSAKQLADTIHQIKQANINILFTEMDYGEKLKRIIETETNIRIYRLTHISRGAYTKDKFAKEMEKNLQTIVQAVRDVQ